MSTAIRRARNPRSRKGCLTCKGRHVQCDERMPFCRNCVRLGRECRYTTVASKQPAASRLETRSEVDARSAGTLQALAKNVMPQHWSLYYCSPHHQNVSSMTIFIVQQSQEIAIRRPMPRSLLMTIAQQGAPKYNFLSARFPCVQHAMIGFSAYTHFHVTKSLVSKQIWVEHACLALSQMQKEINNFGPINADAIITASIALAGTTDDWDQWAVFVDGFSKSLSQIKQKSFKTIYPDLLADIFPLRKFSVEADVHSSPLPKDRVAMKTLVKDLLVAIDDAKLLTGIAKWRATGFQALQVLACTVLEAFSLPSETEEYHRLAIFRSWVFWIDLRQRGGEEEQVLTAFFYVLVLAVVPLMPARYSQPAIELALEKIRASQEGMSEERASEYGLIKIYCAGHDFLRTLGFYTPISTLEL